MGQKKISDLPAASAITGAELVELVQSGASVQSTVNGIKNGAIKIYRALLSQSGTSAPTATILENTLGGTPVWSRNGPGNYDGTLTGAFLPSKTFVAITAQNENRHYTIYQNNNDSVEIDITTSGTTSGIDDQMFNCSVEILVYP